MSVACHAECNARNYIAAAPGAMLDQRISGIVVYVCCVHIREIGARTASDVGNSQTSYTHHRCNIRGKPHEGMHASVRTLQMKCYLYVMRLVGWLVGCWLFGPCWVVRTVVWSVG